MDILSSINQGLNQVLYPGHREKRVDGWEELTKYPMPRDCEGIFLDKDPKSDHIYMKMVDPNGSETCERYKLVPDPVPKFNPENYVTTEEFNSFKEEILDAINSIKQLISAGNEHSSRSNGGGKQFNRSGNEFARPETDVQPNGK